MIRARLSVLVVRSPQFTQFSHLAVTGLRAEPRTIRRMLRAVLRLHLAPIALKWVYPRARCGHR